MNEWSDLPLWAAEMIEAMEPVPTITIPHEPGRGMLRMRPYQVEAVDAIYRAWNDGHGATMCVIPTGMGKTVVASEVVCSWTGDGRWLFVAHLQEILFQTMDAIEKHIGERPGLEMGSYSEVKLRGHGILDRPRVLCASIQTLYRRFAGFNPKDFDGIIFDEAHRAAAKTYRGVWNHFREGNPNIKGLLITATPKRADKISLATVADGVAYQQSILSGIDDGWLVPIRQKFIQIEGLDFRGAKTKTNMLGESDITDGDMARLMMGGDAQSDEDRQKIEQRLHEIAVPTLREAAGRSGIVFCPSVDMCLMLAEVMRRYDRLGNPMVDETSEQCQAQAVVGSTPDDERKDAIRRFRNGQLTWLVFCGIGTEGFDAASASVIVVARPTKSLSLCMQMIGRGLRPLSGLVDAPGMDTPDSRRSAIAASSKPECLVLDFVGVSGNHKFVSTFDVLAGDMDVELVRLVAEKAKQSDEVVDPRAALFKELQLKLKDEEEKKKRLKEIAERRERERQEESKRRSIQARVDYMSREVSPFDVDELTSNVELVPRGGSTDKQISLLIRYGISRETALGYSKRQAGAVIDRMIATRGPAPASAKQLGYLKSLGGVVTPGMTSAQASAAIDRIKGQQGAKR